MSDRLDNAPREAYYGSARQPWDDIVAGGFAAEFAAGSILKYLRRTKGEREKDIAKARWYYARLRELTCPTSADEFIFRARLVAMISWLAGVLSEEELKLIGVGMAGPETGKDRV